MNEHLNPPGRRGALLSTLKVLQGLSDAEHVLLSSWINSDGSEFPSIGNALGPQCRPSIDAERKMDSGDDILANLRDAARHITDLDAADRTAVRDWFHWHNRADLYSRGADDAEIGPLRIIPDDIWPQEPDYLRIMDGTARFVQPTIHLQLCGIWFEWDDLYRLFNKSSDDFNI